MTVNQKFNFRFTVIYSYFTSENRKKWQKKNYLKTGLGKFEITRDGISPPLKLSSPGIAVPQKINGSFDGRMSF